MSLYKMSKQRPMEPQKANLNRATQKSGLPSQFYVFAPVHLHSLDEEHREHTPKNPSHLFCANTIRQQGSKRDRRNHNKHQNQYLVHEKGVYISCDDVNLFTPWYLRLGWILWAESASLARVKGQGCLRCHSRVRQMVVQTPVLVSESLQCSTSSSFAAWHVRPIALLVARWDVSGG